MLRAYSSRVLVLGLIDVFFEYKNERRFCISQAGPRPGLQVPTSIPASLYHTSTEVIDYLRNPIALIIRTAHTVLYEYSNGTWTVLPCWGRTESPRRKIQDDRHLGA